MEHKKEKGIISRAAKGLKSIFGPGHSPAGRRYMVGLTENKKAKKKKEKEIKATGLSKQDRSQLSNLSQSDYDEVMKLLKGGK